MHVQSTPTTRLRSNVGRAVLQPNTRSRPRHFTTMTQITRCEKTWPSMLPSCPARCKSRKVESRPQQTGKRTRLTACTISSLSFPPWQKDRTLLSYSATVARSPLLPPSVHSYLVPLPFSLPSPSSCLPAPASPFRSVSEWNGDGRWSMSPSSAEEGEGERGGPGGINRATSYQLLDS